MCDTRNPGTNYCISTPEKTLFIYRWKDRKMDRQIVGQKAIQKLMCIARNSGTNYCISTPEKQYRFIAGQIERWIDSKIDRKKDINIERMKYKDK